MIIQNCSCQPIFAGIGEHHPFQLFRSTFFQVKSTLPMSPDSKKLCSQQYCFKCMIIICWRWSSCSVSHQCCVSTVDHSAAVGWSMINSSHWQLTMCGWSSWSLFLVVLTVAQMIFPEVLVYYIKANSKMIIGQNSSFWLIVIHSICSDEKIFFVWDICGCFSWNFQMV